MVKLNKEPAAGFRNMDIYEYLDYRKFLKDAYDYHKHVNPNFSYRYIGLKAGFKSAGFFSKILSGKCNITSAVILGLSTAFKLKKAESRYFELLVHYNQARTQSEQQHYYDLILKDSRSKIKALRMDQHELFSRWQYAAIRELLDFFPCADSGADLGKMLRPPCDEELSENAVKTLERLQLIQRTADGKLQKTDSVISTGDDWKAASIHFFQMKMIELARESYDRIPREERDVSTLTLSVSGATVNRIKEILQNTRREILEIAKGDQEADRVMQLNFQLFPLTRTYRKAKSK